MLPVNGRQGPTRRALVSSASHSPRAAMKMRDLRVLRGPNVWAPCPVLEVAIEAGGPALARALAAGARQLQEIAGTPVAFTAAREAGPGLALAAVEFAEEPVARAAVEIAWRLL